MLKPTPETLGEIVRIHELNPGGRLCLVPREGRRCHAVLNVAFGALHEAGVQGGEPAGIAHFLEHRLFEKAAGDIGQRFTDLGADVDAQTGFTSTSYSVTSGTDTFAQALELLFELAGQSHFPHQSVARERSIVGHEIQLFEDNVEWASFQLLLDALYPGQRIAVDIAGTPDSMLAIDGEMLRLCHSRHYRPAAMQLCVCGPLEQESLRDQCNAALALWPQGPAMTPAIDHAPAHNTTLSAKMPLARPRRLLGFADRTPRSGLRLMRHELALEMTLDILFGPRSEFFTRHYESGLLDGDSFGGEVHMDEGYAFCMLGGDADDPDGLQQAILDELHEAATSDWIEQDFERARRRAFGDMVCRWEDVEGTVGFIESACLRGCHPFEVTHLYGGSEAVNLDDVRSCLQQSLCPDLVAVASLGDH